MVSRQFALSRTAYPTKILTQSSYPEPQIPLLDQAVDDRFLRLSLPASLRELRLRCKRRTTSALNYMRQLIPFSMLQSPGLARILTWGGPRSVISKFKEISIEDPHFHLARGIERKRETAPKQPRKWQDCMFRRRLIMSFFTLFPFIINISNSYPQVYPNPLSKFQ